MKFRCSEWAGIGRDMNDGTEIEADDGEDAAAEYAEKRFERDGGAEEPLDEVFVLDESGTERCYAITVDWSATFYARART